jgi:hypothetical protein
VATLVMEHDRTKSKNFKDLEILAGVLIIRLLIACSQVLWRCSNMWKRKAKMIRSVKLKDSSIISEDFNFVFHLHLEPK